MARKDYRRQLESLREGVLEMSEMVLTQLARSLEAYAERDEARARSVVEGDDAINDRYLDLEGDCVGLLALQQPVAGDLRFIASSFKIITDLERVGDLAVNLAQYSMAADRNRYPDIDIEHIGRSVLRMLEDAMDAYATDNAEATTRIADTDDEIDDLCERASAVVVRDLVDATTSDGTLLEDVSRMLLTIRDLERVGDHAVNIAARTLYMVENDDELLY